MPQVTSNRTRGKKLRMHQGRFRLDTKKNVFTGRMARPWNRLPREVMKFLVAFKKCVDVALRDVF